LLKIRDPFACGAIQGSPTGSLTLLRMDLVSQSGEYGLGNGVGHDRVLALWPVPKYEQLIDRPNFGFLTASFFAGPGALPLPNPPQASAAGIIARQ
jgi:hypothetical protein